MYLTYYNAPMSAFDCHAHSMSITACMGYTSTLLNEYYVYNPIGILIFIALTFSLYQIFSLDSQHVKSLSRLSIVAHHWEINQRNCLCAFWVFSSFFVKSLNTQ